MESNIFNAELLFGSMASIEVETEINATPEMVWEIVSDIDNEPKFWKGTKEVRNISKQDGKVIREITIAFRDQKCMQEVTIEPKNRIHAVFTEGIIDGTKTMTLKPDDQKTTLEVVWEMKLTGMMGMFTGMIKKHIKSGTEQAIDSIRKEVESQ